MNRWVRLVVYLALAAWLVWPMPLDPGGVIVGHAEATAPMHVWVIWWAGHHLGDWHSSLLFFPEGADVVRLYGSDFLSPPLLGLLPLAPGEAWNAWVVFLLVLGAMGSDRLCRQTLASSAGALLGGVIFETAPFFQHELLNGTSEILGAAWLPWVAVALLEVLDRPRDGRGLALGALVALATATSVYNAFFVLLLGGVIVVHRLVTCRDAVLTGPVLRALGLAACLAGALLAPMAWLELRHGAGATLAQRGDWKEARLPDAFADLLAWVDRSPAKVPALVPWPDGTTFAYWTTGTVYLGWVALALAAVAIWRRRASGAWGVALLAAVLLGAGPDLRAAGTHLVAGPAVAVAALLPPFALTALHAYRYAAVAVVAVSVLAGLAVRRWRAAVPAVALVLLDAVALSPVPRATTPLPRSSALEALAEAPAGAVLTLPTTRDELGALGRMLLAQTVHGKPVQDGGIHRRAGKEATRLFRDLPLLADTSDLRGARWPDLPTSRWSLERLTKLGYRYLLVPGTDDRAMDWAAGLLGPPAVRDDAWAWWVLADAGG